MDYVLFCSVFSSLFLFIFVNGFWLHGKIASANRHLKKLENVNLKFNLLAYLFQRKETFISQTPDARP